ncbi:MAG: hypothetical protein JW946_05000 [Candidatus Omnitrophica bacterium]|nr:hypothetical protein [Candidatus Omnitrophota bacterium]
MKMLLEHPKAKVTINICGVLTEMLNDHGATDVLAHIKELSDNKQLEFVDSAKYHAILPLIPEKETRRQIELNHKTNSYFFKESYKVKGFFPPEMCYSDEVGAILSDMEYEWVLISGIACAEKWPLDVIYNVPFNSTGIKVFFRDDILSNKISFHNVDNDSFFSELKNLGKGKRDIYVITAMDAETFGHHIQNWEKLFLAEVYETIENMSDGSAYKQLKQKTDLADAHRKIFESSEQVPQVEVVTISELLDKFSKKESKPPKKSSWSSSKEDLTAKNYYPLWNDPSNHVHRLQWEHARICLELVGGAYDLKDNPESSRFTDISRGLLDRAIHSCQFWWANKAKGLWDINLINKGLVLQEEVVLNAYRAIKVSGADEEDKREFYHDVTAARDIANKIRDQLFIM